MFLATYAGMSIWKNILSDTAYTFFDVTSQLSSLKGGGASDSKNPDLYYYLIKKLSGIWNWNIVGMLNLDRISASLVGYDEKCTVDRVNTLSFEFDKVYFLQLLNIQDIHWESET